MGAPVAQVRVGAASRPAPRSRRSGRRGKYLLLGLDDERELVVHLGMTGQLRLRPGELDPYVRAWWALDDGRVLELRDVRRFGRIGRGAGGGVRVAPDARRPGSRAVGRRPRRRRAVAQPQAQPRAHQDPAPVAAAARRGRQHLRRRGALAGRHPPRPPHHHPAGGRRAARASSAPCSSRGSPTGAPPCATTARSRASRAATSSSSAATAAPGEPCDRCGTELRRSVIDARGTTHCPTCQPRR